jgi:hypothetical protein
MSIGAEDIGRGRIIFDFVDFKDFSEHILNQPGRFVLGLVEFPASVTEAAGAFSFFRGGDLWGSPHAQTDWPAD